MQTKAHLYVLCAAALYGSDVNWAYNNSKSGYPGMCGAWGSVSFFTFSCWSPILEMYADWALLSEVLHSLHATLVTAQLSCMLDAECTLLSEVLHNLHATLAAAQPMLCFSVLACSAHLLQTASRTLWVDFALVLICSIASQTLTLLDLARLSSKSRISHRASVVPAAEQPGETI